MIDCPPLLFVSSPTVPLSACSSLSSLAEQKMLCLPGTLVRMRLPVSTSTKFPHFCLRLSSSLRRLLTFDCAALSCLFVTSRDLFYLLLQLRSTESKHSVTRCRLLTCRSVTLFCCGECVCSAPVPLPVQTDLAEKAMKASLVGQTEKIVLQNNWMHICNTQSHLRFIPLPLIFKFALAPQQNYKV